MRSVTTFWLTCLPLVLAVRADAVCNQTEASQTDIALWETRKCFEDFIPWHIAAYALTESDWVGRGWNDKCDIKLEYAKHSNAAYLLTYGLTDGGNQFHGTIDYRRAAEAAASAFHDQVRTTISDGTTFFGSYDDGTITTYCPLYNFDVYQANPASRGGNFVHEGWHAWLEKYNYNNGPKAGHRGPTGPCEAESCDYFYLHDIGEYAFGDMWQQDGTANRFHSPIQVQVEYLCDVAESSKFWVPASLKLVAKTESNARALTNFINEPGYVCGDASPY
jgi:hypothetical protein